MPIARGSSVADAIYRGASAVDKVYRGDQLVWDPVPPEPNRPPTEWRFTTDNEGWTYRTDVAGTTGPAQWSAGTDDPYIYTYIASGNRSKKLAFTSALPYYPDMDAMPGATTYKIRMQIEAVSALADLYTIYVIGVDLLGTGEVLGEVSLGPGISGTTAKRWLETPDINLDSALSLPTWMYFMVSKDSGSFTGQIQMKVYDCELINNLGNLVLARPRIPG